jgi:predicted helicase
VFEQLSHEFIKKTFIEDKIYNIGRYWDDDKEIDLVAKTKSGKKIVGLCKYTDKKLKKSELSKLKELSIQAEIKPDIYVIFAKKGYTSELKALKSENILLFTCRNFKVLI